MGGVLGSVPYLLLDHALPTCSVAVMLEDQVLAEAYETEPQRQAEALAGMVHSCLHEAGVSVADLLFVGCHQGPGSYTGLRIGASLAQGLALPWAKPLVGVSTLEAMVWSLWTTGLYDSEWWVPTLDARRQEVYTGVYAMDGDQLVVVQKGEARILDLDFGALWEGRRVCLLGDGAAKCRTLYEEAGMPLPCTYLVEAISPKASLWAGLAQRRFLEGRACEASLFKVDYHKAFYSTARPKV